MLVFVEELILVNWYIKHKKVNLKLRHFLTMKKPLNSFLTFTSNTDLSGRIMCKRRSDYCYDSFNILIYEPWSCLQLSVKRVTPVLEVQIIVMATFPDQANIAA